MSWSPAFYASQRHNCIHTMTRQTTNRSQTFDMITNNLVASSSEHVPYSHTRDDGTTGRRDDGTTGRRDDGTTCHRILH